MVVYDKSPDFALQIEQVSPNIAMIVKTFAKMLHTTGLKKFYFMQMNFEAGLCQARWVVENQFVAVIFLMPEAKNSGLGKIHLDKMCDYIRHLLIEK